VDVENSCCENFGMNICDLLKFYTHQHYFQEMVRKDIDAVGLVAVLKVMVQWINTEANRLTRLPKCVRTIVAPKLQDEATKIVEPDGTMNLTLASAKVGAQLMCYKLPAELLAMKPWTTEQIDAVMDGLLMLLDIDKAEDLHWADQISSKAEKLKPCQKKTGQIVRQRQEKFCRRRWPGWP